MIARIRSTDSTCFEGVEQCGPRNRLYYYVCRASGSALVTKGWSGCWYLLYWFLAARLMPSERRAGHLIQAGDNACQIMRGHSCYQS